MPFPQPANLYQCMPCAYSFFIAQIQAFGLLSLSKYPMLSSYEILLPKCIKFTSFLHHFCIILYFLVEFGGALRLSLL